VEDPPNPNDIPLPPSEGQGQDDFESVTNSENEGDMEDRNEDAGVVSGPSRGPSPNESITSWQTAALLGSETQGPSSPARRDTTPTPTKMLPEGPPKTRVYVKDVAYRTYYAMLYYVSLSYPHSNIVSIVAVIYR
jgi:hypothetical protein